MHDRPSEIAAIAAPTRNTAMRPLSSATQIRPSIHGMVTAAMWLIVKETPAVAAISARIRDLAEIALDGDRQREEQVVEDIERGGHPGDLDEGVGDEDADQSQILQDQRRAFAPLDDQAADARGEPDGDDVVGREERDHGLGPVAEFGDHEEGGEADEDLAAPARHELQRVVEAVALLQDHGHGLEAGFAEARKEGPAEEARATP